MAPHPSKPRRSLMEQARESLSRASSELSLLAEVASAVGQPAADGTGGVIKATEGGYRRLQECCADAMTNLVQCICCTDCFTHTENVEGTNEEAPPEPLASAFFLIVVALIILLLYLAFIFVYMPHAQVAWSSPLSIFFNWCMVMCNICYARGCSTDPGGVPDTPEWRDGTATTHERKKATGARRFCEKEKIYKPDRAHYSQLLQKNVRRMDHHCPWLNNTIGFWNYKYFFQFILYATVLTDTIASLVLHLLLNDTGALSAGVSFFLWETEILSALLGFVLTPFTLLHVWLVSRNMTTIELCETQRSESSTPLHMYDLGVFKNWTQIMGHPLTWLIPVGGPEGDGLHFPLHPNFNDKAPEVQEETDARGSAVSFVQERTDDFALGCVVIGSGVASCFSLFKECLFGKEEEKEERSAMDAADPLI